MSRFAIVSVFFFWWSADWFRIDTRFACTSQPWTAICASTRRIQKFWFMFSNRSTCVFCGPRGRKRSGKWLMYENGDFSISRSMIGRGKCEVGSRSEWIYVTCEMCDLKVDLRFDDLWDSSKVERMLIAIDVADDQNQQDTIYAQSPQENAIKLIWNWYFYSTSSSSFIWPQLWRTESAKKNYAKTFGMDEFEI